MKLKIPDQHSDPIDNGVGMGEENKIVDSIQSTGSYQHVSINKEQIDIQDEMNKFAPQVHNNVITLSKQFAEPVGTLESNADVSMTSNSLWNRIAESSLGSGTMSFEDIQKTVMHIDKYADKDEDASAVMEEDLAMEMSENESLFK